MTKKRMIWDERAGKLVPETGGSSETDNAKGGTAEELEVTRLQGDKRESTPKVEEGESNKHQLPLQSEDEEPDERSIERERSERHKNDAPQSTKLPGPPPRFPRTATDDFTRIHGSMTEGDEQLEVAGWLAYLDRSSQAVYSIVHFGQNSIGRGDTNSIVIEGESSVTREAAAFIVIDPEDGTGYLRPGLGRSVVRVNGQLVTESKVITASDSIKIGEFTCVYVPFPWNALTQS